MSKVYEFTAQIQKHDSLDAAFIEFPYQVEEEFGTRGQVKVRATFDGHEYRGSLARMGHRCHCLGITQAIRRQIGKEPGDRVAVTLVRDEAPRIVEVPPELDQLLASNPKSRAFFDGLSYTQRKEYVNWITGAKREETRKRRLGQILDMLRKGVRHP